MQQDDLIRWAIAVGIAVGVWFIGWIVTRLILPRIARLVQRSETRVDDLLLAAVRPHVPLWFLGIGILIATRQLGLDQQWVTMIDQLVKAGILLSITIAIASFLTSIIANRAVPWLAGLPSTGLIQGTVQIGVIALGALVILTNMGVAITPILTALGVGSLAVALALQPTLTNLFAGFYITLARQIRVGDYIELESGQKGYVTDIGWRTTTIRELPNNLIVIPNGKISEIIVTNYSLPEDEQSIVLQVGVSYNSDLPEVERITIEVAREMQQTVTGAKRDHEPFTRYHTFGDSSISFSVILRVETFVDRYLLTHEFHKRLHERYAKEGIEIPFPQRVVHLEGGAKLKPSK